MTVKLDDPASGLNTAFGGKGFEIADEIFRFQAPYSRRKVHILLSVDVARTDMNQGGPRGACVRKDNDCPISWIRRGSRSAGVAGSRWPLPATRAAATDSPSAGLRSELIPTGQVPAARLAAGEWDGDW